jgi:antitoxin ParD1/3/4
MNITFRPDQIKWLDEQVAAGAYASVEEAVRAAIAELMSVDDDLEWAKPLVDEARDAIARGEGLKAADVRAETEAYLRSLGG